ncbi:hypothetical protein SAMN04489860_0313 [Paraoerskovia marina]|uniref:Uncharacterized protein n=1 Tax=Paraoerskovia marina TaxID=545619 RepID=A0A1H1MRJ6_9CELL|nr:hypothetical protein [Paraoerskovia marina]SDR89260.1 hypothetical protein SAMN04489860_0313 [Paraoerskovia marina]
MSTAETPRRNAVYGRATTVDSRRSTIKASDREAYVRDVARIREAASKGR